MRLFLIVFRVVVGSKRSRILRLYPPTVAAFSAFVRPLMAWQ